ncbi:hypothetical protein OH77DRAFT_593052 [Trametes cingulata]|nr:hypothetical protein OH77DRAFT_593052 [Trametes cingulata]
MVPLASNTLRYSGQPSSNHRSSALRDASTSRRPYAFGLVPSPCGMRMRAAVYRFHQHAVAGTLPRFVDGRDSDLAFVHRRGVDCASTLFSAAELLSQS